jgi:hypothetical protein
MKKYIAITIALLALAMPALAQTTNTTPSDLSKLWTDVQNFFTDAQPFLTNHSATVEAGALCHRGDWGGFADLQLPIANQASIGFGGAYLNHSWYDATVSARVGTTWKVPVIGAIYTYLESGPGYNFSTKEVIGQSFAGAIIKRTLSKNWYLTAGLAAGNITDLAGPVYAGGASLNFPW